MFIGKYKDNFIAEIVYQIWHLNWPKYVFQEKRYKSQRMYNHLFLVFGKILTRVILLLSQDSPSFLPQGRIVIMGEGSDIWSSRISGTPWKMPGRIYILDIFKGKHYKEK